MHLNIISYNINGIRAGVKKGLLEWIQEEDPDVICFQEVKAEMEQAPIEEIKALGYEYIYWHSAQKKGYSGVATLSKIPATYVKVGMDNDKYDSEGRILQTDFNGISLINAYFPSGSSGDERQAFKYDFLDDFFDYIEEHKKDYPNIVLCGDYNICHKPIDIHNPQRNKNTSGFLEEERTWVTKFLESGFHDAFRAFHEEAHRYSWWSYRAAARKKNLGWRIDYFTVSSSIKDKMIDCDILDQVFHSDHCPVKLSISAN